MHQNVILSSKNAEISKYLITKREYIFFNVIFWLKEGLSQQYTFFFFFALLNEILHNQPFSPT